jgi:hypothetical protein
LKNSSTILFLYRQGMSHAAWRVREEVINLAIMVSEFNGWQLPVATRTAVALWSCTSLVAGRYGKFLRILQMQAMLQHGGSSLDTTLVMRLLIQVHRPCSRRTCIDKKL